MAPLESDEEFLSYVYYHSETERHLFSRDHVVRLFKLAGAEDGVQPEKLSDFVGVGAEMAQPLVAKARERLRGKAESSEPVSEPSTMTVVGRLHMKGPRIDFYMYLPLVSGRFQPGNFSFPWPLAHGKWDGNEYTAEMDYDERMNIAILKWSDGFRTTFELKIGLMLKKDMIIGLNQEQPAKYFALTVADLDWL